MQLRYVWFLPLLLLAFLMTRPIPWTSASDLVQWIDEKGVLHFSDSMENVPPKYRGHIKLEKLKENDTQKGERADRNPAQAKETRVAGTASDPPKEKSKPNSYEVPFEAYEGTASG